MHRENQLNQENVKIKLDEALNCFAAKVGIGIVKGVCGGSILGGAVGFFTDKDAYTTGQFALGGLCLGAVAAVMVPILRETPKWMKEANETRKEYEDLLSKTEGEV